MKRTLNAHLRAWHLMLAVVLLVALNGGSVLAKIGPNAFRPAGTFMVASASATDTLAIGATDTVVLSRAITVPAGKTADLFASFNADAACGASGGAIFVELRLDSPTGTAFAPGELWQTVANDDVAFEQLLSFQGYKYSAPAGPHTVYVTMDTSCSGGGGVYQRSLVITANIHD